jgi:putative peptide modification system cyclase
MSALPAPATAPPAPTPAQATPQLRTLLLTDLVDSTGTVERLGDGPSAELFRAHDRLVLELQQRWRGRLIDRSDGLLLMFERAIDGLGFALDYNRGLRELGKAHGVPLQARAGLHVGEVLTWRNSAEAVAVGAKPLEVEGLAKPLAGRLLGLARPGQILLSATAEALAHRAARELGERGTQLAWKSHGRWRFKGLPEPLEVYEAGEPGLAPLQAPRPDAKAWRDIPFWRRPAALAAELALVAVVAVGVWFFTRPQPAIAFAERDWVVVADMRNLTGQPVLDESLQQAFRISLEQSRHVNVLSDLKARDTLARMQRQPGTALDREIASEIAVRDGARAVILPTVAEVGGRVRVSAEVIDPQSQTTVYAEYADGSGLDSVLASVDTVTAALRGRLGEEIKAIERDSEPLPQVTTSNLDALRAYALGQKAFGRREFVEAEGFYMQATRLDPRFALAHLGLVRSKNAQDRFPDGLQDLRRAHALRHRMPVRDRLYIEAWVAEAQAPAEVLEKWKRMAALYPDAYPALANVAYASASRNLYGQGLEYAKRALVPTNQFAPLSREMVGRMAMALGDHEQAESAFTGAATEGSDTAALRLATLYAAQGRFDRADAVFEKFPKGQVVAGHFDRAAILLDRGNASAAVAEARRIQANLAPESVRSTEALVILASVQWLAGQGDLAMANTEKAVDQALAAMPDANSKADEYAYAMAATAGAMLGYRMGLDLGTRVLDRVAPDAALPAQLRAFLTVLEAEKLRASGEPVKALKRLEPVFDGAEPIQAHAVALHAHLDMGDIPSALKEQKWLRAHRPRAYAEYGCRWCQQPMNVADTTLADLHLGEALAARNRVSDAARHIADFDRQWPRARLPNYLRLRRDAVVATFN